MDHVDRETVDPAELGFVGGLVNLTNGTFDESAGAFSLWGGSDSAAGISGCTGENDRILVGITAGGVALVARMTRDQALRWGRSLVDLANQ